MQGSYRNLTWQEKQRARKFLSEYVRAMSYILFFLLFVYSANGLAFGKIDGGLLSINLHSQSLFFTLMVNFGMVVFFLFDNPNRRFRLNFNVYTGIAFVLVILLFGQANIRYFRGEEEAPVWIASEALSAILFGMYFMFVSHLKYLSMKKRVTPRELNAIEVL